MDDGPEAPHEKAAGGNRHDDEARFQALVESSTQGIIVHRQFEPLFANLALARIFGYDDPGQILALESLDTLFPAQEVARLHAYGMARLPDEPAPRMYEIEALRRDGSRTTLSNVSSRVVWDGAPAVMTHVVDVTARRQGEREVLASERLLRTVVGHSAIILWSIDATGTVRLAEGRGLAAQGLTPAEVVGRSIFDLYARNHEFLGHVRRALAGEAFTATSETRGAFFERSFQPICDENGEVESVIGVSFDVTHIKRAERQARESEQLLRSVIDGLPHLIFLKDCDLRYRLVNRSFARFHGLTPDEVVDQDGASFPRRTDEIQASFIEDDRRVLAEGKPVHRTGYTVHAADGTLADFEAVKLPLRDDSGEIVGVVGIADDVTETRRAQRELERYRERLEELVEARTADLVAAQDELVRAERMSVVGQVVATVSHELRNPLGTISTSIRTLRPYLDGSDERAGRAIERIERNITRCVHIIEEMLDFTRARPVNLTSCVLDDFIEETASALQPPDGIVLQLDTDARIPVRIDPERLAHALGNLVNNAYQSLRDGTPPGQPRKVIIETRVEEGRPRIQIIDNGPGVAAEDLSRIFDPLFSTRNFGVGLGLPLARSIARQHGGELEHVADRPFGCTFRLWLLAGGEPAPQSD